MDLRNGTIEIGGLVAAVEQAADGIVITDLTGKIQYVNPAFTAMTGYSSDESVGRHPRIIKSGCHPEAFYKDLWTTIQSGRVWQGEVINRRKDGSLYHEEMRIAPVRDSEGKSVNYIAIKHDVTKRRVAEEAQEFLAAIVENSDDAVIALTPTGFILTWNRGAEAIFGYTAAEAIGKHASLILDAEDPSKLEHFTAHVLAGKSISQEEGLGHGKNGLTFHVSVTGCPIRNSAGEVAAISTILRDTSERHQADQDRAFLASIVEYSDEAILGLTVDGIIVSWNRGAENLFGYSREESMGKNVTMLAPADRNHEVNRSLTTVRNGREINPFETIRQRKDGSLVDISLSVSPIRNRAGEIVGAAAIYHDIGTRLLAERRLRENEEAAHVLAEEAAAASSLAKSQFLAKISHDIRTPLNAILGAADLLAQSPLNADQAEYVSMFQRNSRRLVALINDFLDFSKIEAGELQVENIPYRVRDVVQEAMATFSDSALRKGVKLGCRIGEEVPEWEIGDPLRVHQVLVNLLSNAVKFTHQGQIGLSVRLAGFPGSEELNFEVSDSGAGIRAEDQEGIFAAFVQSAQQSRTAAGGCGLGLAICRQLVELMGGKIGVTSQEGRGSTFHFSLPLVAVRSSDAAVEKSACEPSRHQPEQQKAVRILVAEDTEDNRILLSHYVRGESIELHFVINGQEAVDTIHRGEEFDLILMDLDMPVRGGLSAARAILAHQNATGAAGTPIVALSAHAMCDAVRECLDAGCVAHVAKPVDRATLLRTIRSYARSRDIGECIELSSQLAALVPKYLASKHGQLDEAAENLRANDFEPIRRFGHNLKGTGSGYGFPRISLIGREIEEAATSRDNQTVSEQLDALRRFLLEDARTVPLDVEVSR